MTRIPQKPALAVDSPVHFVGIGGSGMSALAELALKGGLAVQGTDSKSSDATDHLLRLGVKVAIGHAAAALGSARTVVFSSAIAPENVELAAARTRGLAILHRSEFLAFLMQSREAVTVAGTHGKSTTTAMIAHVLDALGCDPSVACGAPILRFSGAARFGNGPYFIAEADESDGSFLRYRPTIGVLTNIASDHMEYFKDAATLEAAFSQYLGNIVEDDGCAVIGWDNPISRDVGSRYERNRLTYGFLLGCDVRGLEYQCAGGEMTFTAMVERDRVKVRLKTIGKHNAQNALCALAVVRALALDVTKAAESLASFAGVARRFSLVYDSPAVKVFDDYAHNPGKIEACITGIRESWPDWKVHAVFQPHRFSRLETMFDEMIAALRDADIVHVLPVYSAGETTTRDFSPELLAAELRLKHGVEAHACRSFVEAAQSVRNRLEYPAVVLTVGAGDVWRVADLLKDGLNGTLSGQSQAFGSGKTKA